MTAAITNTTDSVNAFLTRLHIKTAARAAALRRDDGMSTIEYSEGKV